MFKDKIKSKNKNYKDKINTKNKNYKGQEKLSKSTQVNLLNWQPNHEFQIIPHKTNKKQL